MKRSLYFLILSLFTFLACSNVVIAVESGLTTCTKCGNVITAENKKFSVIQKDASRPVAFDDIGCAILWRDNQCTAIQMSFDATAKAYDFYTEEELDIGSAFFAIAPVIQSPVGYGIVAFKDKASADKFFIENGGDKVLRYDDVLLLNLN